MRTLTRRAFVADLGTKGTGLLAGSQSGYPPGNATRSGATLENAKMRLIFDRDTGLMVKIENKLTGETWEIRGDDFRVEATEFTLTRENTRLKGFRRMSPEAVEASYHAGGCTLKVFYTLLRNNHFLQKHFILSSISAFGLKKLVIGRYAFVGPKLELIKYAWLKNAVYFGRATKGGMILGVELPFENSSLDRDGGLTLGYAPNVKVAANEPLSCEPVYLGVYVKEPEDAELPHLTLGKAQMMEPFYKMQFGDKAPPHFPLRSESAAMVAMTSTILGRPRARLAAVLDGWESEMTYASYETAADVQGEKRSIDFAAECGMSYVAGGSIWGGAVARVNGLRDDDKLRLGELAVEVAAHARARGLGWQLWHSVTSTNPWDKCCRNPLDGKRRYPPSQPYRPDEPGWQVRPTPEGVTSCNCFAHEPFFEWLYKVVVEAIDGGKFAQWMVDGDFFGGLGVVKPVNCSISGHSHVPGDSTYACERNLIELARRIRERYPDIHMFWERPAMDLGVWMMRHMDASFTVDEFAKPISLPGVANQPINLILADKIRTWSRLRVQMQFLPHYLDQPMVFTTARSEGAGYDWESEGIDYIMLSALACSPNQNFYLPSKSGIPQRDKLTIKNWLDWGRKNIRYLMVRRDLPEWPAAGKVDGFAHIIRDRGFVFLFNPNSKPLQANFHLDGSIGLAAGTKFNVAAWHPTKVVKRGLSLGQELDWLVGGQSALLLEITPS